MWLLSKEQITDAFFKGGRERESKSLLNLEDGVSIAKAQLKHVWCKLQDYALIDAKGNCSIFLPREVWQEIWKEIE